MRIATFSAGNGPRAGLVLGDMVADLALASESMVKADARALLGQPFGSRTEELLARPDGLKWAADLAEWLGRTAGKADGAAYLHKLDAVQLKAPLLRPEKILGVGLNYGDHAREMGRDPPKEMRVFGMYANALVGTGENVILPKTSTQMDWEAELVVVVGKPAKHVPAERALEYVAGYTVGNDISARDHQQADPMVMRGKNGDTHAPVGPWIVTPDELGNYRELDISLTVNGVTKQSSNTSELVFGVEDIIAFLSFYYTLAPGDMIFTGTPAGVGVGRKPQEWLKPGDRVDVTIERIGTLSNLCVAEPA